jgi:hypothetical protein
LPPPKVVLVEVDVEVVGPGDVFDVEVDVLVEVVVAPPEVTALTTLE